MLSNVDSEMAMPQRDDTVEAIKRLDALLEHAVIHSDESRPFDKPPTHHIAVKIINHLGDGL